MAYRFVVSVGDSEKRACFVVLLAVMVHCYKVSLLKVFLIETFSVDYCKFYHSL